MNPTDTATATGLGDKAAATLEASARRHLWMPFNPPARPAGCELPVMVRGEGCHLYDAHGRRYLDSFASICSVALGHGRTDLVEAAVEQARELCYTAIWTHGHPAAIRLAERIAQLAPEGLERVFLTSGGSEAVESALKLARQYHRLRGKPGKTKVIARETAYHGLTFGALSATGITPMRAPFEPLLAGGRHVPNTNPYRLPEGMTLDGLAEAIDHAIRFEGPDTVAAVILEPVQNGGGCLPPPDGYFQRVREICDEHDVLLISDEVICAWGRLGYWFGAQRYDYRPDLITTAKALAAGYAPMGALLVSDAVADVFNEAHTPFLHGYTFSGHPIACAIALAALDALEREGVLDNVRANEHNLREMLETFSDLPIVGNVRGDGYFQAIEFVKDRATKEPFAPDEALRLTRLVVERAFERGVLARSDVRGYPVMQVAPPLIAGPAELDEFRTAMRPVLEDACEEMGVS